MSRNKRQHPHRIGEKLFRLILPETERGALLGDYEELYKDLSQRRGRFIANLWYWLQLIVTIPSVVMDSIKWSLIMIRNYLKIAFRNLQRQKIYSFINIAGLVTGLTCFILMMLYIYHELGFDQFHEKYDHLYRVIRKYPENPNIPFRYLASSPAPLAPTMIEEFPEVVTGTRVGEVTGTMRYENKMFSEDGLFADDQFFELFSFSLLKGNPQTCLRQPFTIVITEKMARKFFGTEDPFGKILNFSKQMNVSQTGSQNENYDLTITGVIQDVPNNSHLQFDYIISMITLASTPGNRNLLEQWGRSNYYNYVELIPGIEHEHLHERLAEYSPRFRGNDVARYVLQPLKDLHWTLIPYDMPGIITSDKKNLYLFSIIAFMILIIACINYMNLTTARLSQRTMEIGLRKVVGAQKSQLIKQFLGESFLFSLIAACFAVLMARLAFPSFCSLVDRDMHFNLFSNPWIPIFIFGTVLFAGLFSGSYPALFLSSFKPINILKGAQERTAGRRGLRHALVVIQFIVSVFLMTGTLAVWQQLRFIRHTDIGYDRDHVIVLPLRDALARKNGHVLSEALRRHDNIHAVSGSEYIPLERNNINTLQYTNETGETTSVSAYTCEIGYEFFDVFGIQITDGRAFSREYGTDVQNAILLNQTAVQALGMKDPIGKIFYGKLHVVGVIKDYHHASLHDKIDPMMFSLRPDAYTFLSVRIKPGDISGTLDFIKKTVEEYSPHFAFEYYFQDDYFNEKYKSDQRFGMAFGYASGLAIMIACLGIFGLISFSTQRRTKEIAIRRVLGASFQNIYGRLSKEFIVLVTLAVLLAWPVAYFFMNKWLQNFAYRVSLNVWIFMLSGLAALVIALLTISYQIMKAASHNPVEALHYE